MGLRSSSLQMCLRLKLWPQLWQMWMLRMKWQWQLLWQNLLWVELLPVPQQCWLPMLVRRSLQMQSEDTTGAQRHSWAPQVTLLRAGVDAPCSNWRQVLPADGCRSPNTFTARVK